MSRRVFNALERSWKLEESLAGTKSPYWDPKGRNREKETWNRGAYWKYERSWDADWSVLRRFITEIRRAREEALEWTSWVSVAGDEDGLWRIEEIHGMQSFARR